MNNISVLIPTHNGSEYILGAIDSVFTQTLLPDEIIIVDDGSNDGTMDLVKSVMGNVSIKAIQLRNSSGGPAVPLNVAIKNSKSEFIAILEQDDRMRPSRLASQLRALQENPECNISVGRASVIGREEGDVSDIWGKVAQFENVIETPLTPPPQFVISSEDAFCALLMKQFALSNSTIFARRYPVAKLGGFDESIRRCTDLDFLLKHSSSSPIAIVGDIICDYRFRENSLFRSSLLQNYEVEYTRLKWAIKKGQWDHIAVQGIYWYLRSEMRNSLRKIQIGNLWKILRTLSRSGALSCHFSSMLHQKKQDR